MRNAAYTARDLDAYMRLQGIRRAAQGETAQNDTARLFTLPLADTAPRTGQAVELPQGSAPAGCGLPDYIDLISERSER